MSDVLPAVRCRGLTYAFGTHRAVDDVDLERAARRDVRPARAQRRRQDDDDPRADDAAARGAGVAHVFGRDVARERMSVRKLIGYVPQQLSAEAALTGRENVMLFARLFDVPRRERADRRRAGAGRDRHARARRPAGRRRTPGGMVRRLELAQALVNRPRLLILDEPTIGLDPIARGSVWDLIAELRAENGMTVLLTTHYMDEAEELLRPRRPDAPRPAARRGLAERAEGSTSAPDATLDDVFRHHAGDLPDDEPGGLRDVRRTRRTAIRLG